MVFYGRASGTDQRIHGQRSATCAGGAVIGRRKPRRRKRIVGRRIIAAACAQSGSYTPTAAAATAATAATAGTAANAAACTWLQDGGGSVCKGFSIE